MKSVLFFVLILNTSLCFAKLLYSAGTYVPYFNKVQTDDSGSTRKFDLTPYLGIGSQLQLSGPHFFTPEFGLVYYLSNAKKNSKRIFFLHYDFTYLMSEKFLLRYGLTNHWYQISGSGGTVTLNNGTSSSDFPAPSKTSTSYFTTLDLGFEYILDFDQAIRFDLNIMSPANQENMAFNYLLTFNLYR